MTLAHLHAAGRKARDSEVHQKRPATRACTPRCGAGGNSFSVSLTECLSISVSILISTSLVFLLLSAVGVRGSSEDRGREDPAKAATIPRGHGLGRQPGV